MMAFASRAFTRLVQQAETDECHHDHGNDNQRDLPKTRHVKLLG
jgi:hypothetical protein